ncbi:MAG: hypothetical protein J5590_00420 [Clostridia bacterium]|nr:hypothetical protein [Clostridia bacterium]
MTRKQKIFLAIPAFSLAMIGDYLMGINSIGTDSTGKMVWNVVADWRLALSAVLGMLCAVLFAVSAIETCKMLEARHPKSKYVKLFKISNYAGILFFTFIHIAICMLIVIFNAGFEATGNTELAKGMLFRVAKSVSIPLILQFVFTDVLVTIAWFGIVLKGDIKLPKWTVILNPIIIALIGQLINFIPFSFMGADSGFESFGWLLMYAAIYYSEKKNTKWKSI